MFFDLHSLAIFKKRLAPYFYAFKQKCGNSDKAFFCKFVSKIYINKNNEDMAVKYLTQYYDMMNLKEVGQK
jgi:hypothetical protein